MKTDLTTNHDRVSGALDKVLFRALSLNPRHRYQRAFVLREDLRGLMAGFSFADIEFCSPRISQQSTEWPPNVSTNRSKEIAGGFRKTSCFDLLCLKQKRSLL